MKNENYPPKNNNRRDLNLDLYRGIAALGVISIHTAFKSGSSYVPDWFRTITLLIDVSYFFFIAGRSIRFYEGNLFKTSKSLLKTWLKWVYSISVLAAVCYITGNEGVKNIRDLVQNYFFNISFPSLAMINESIWFMPYYFVIVLLNQIILSCMSQSKDMYEKYKKWYCGMLFAAFIWVITKHDFLGINQYYLFYSFFLMLGVLSDALKEKISEKPLQSIFVVYIGYFVSCYLTNMPYFDLQQSKFPPNLPYLLASMLFIVITVSINKYIKNPNKFLVHIGQNAIFYFIGQGVGSSLLYSIVPHIQIEAWFIKWIVAFIINILITAASAELLSFGYNIIGKIRGGLKQQH